ANLSRFIQCVELDLREFEGMIPIEVFSKSPFPAIGDLPYFLTLGPHAFYWFALDPTGVSSTTKPSFSSTERATITVSDNWTSLLIKKQERTILEGLLPTYLNRCRWFDGKTRFILSTTISEVIPVPYDQPIGYLTMVHVEYVESDVETYILPLIYATGAEADRIAQEVPQAVVTHITLPERNETGILYDAMYNHQFAITLLEAVAQHRSFRGHSGEVMAFPIRSFSLRSSTRDQYTSTAVHNGDRDSTPAQEPHTNNSHESVTAWDGSHTIVDYNDQYTLKLFRRVEAGINPDLEIGRFLTEKVSLARAPQVFGAFEYHQRGSDAATIAVLHKAVPNQGTAWRHTQTVLKNYYERVQQTNTSDSFLPLPHQHIFELAGEAVDELATTLIGAYLETAQLLGQRTAELHLAFTQETEDAHFTPEPFTDFFQRPFYYAMLGLIDRDFRLLRQQQQHFEASVREDVERVINLEHEMRQYFKPFRDRKVTAMRMRCHGNYHLGNVLWADNDFVIVDFEGEPTRSLEERRTKTSPLRDVASMLRSFQYAAYAALLLHETEGTLQTIDQHTRENWARFWYTWVSAVFLRTYLDTASQSPLLLQTPEECQMLLDAYLLEKALYELGYELSHRPEWIRIPLQGIIQLLETHSGN
ncbi:MAG: putative maltokinase, partial [Chloroflexota bacterium]